MNVDFIPLARPDINEEDIALVAGVLRSGMIVQGEYVSKLEGEIASITSSENAIVVSNGTATMHLALVLLGIGPGDEVIVPAFSFVATANVVELVGAKPIFVDIDIDTFNISTALIEQAITPRTKAIIPVHEFGLACDIERVCEIAKRHNLFVIEDAACALGAKQNDKPVGSFGDFGSFSFHPRKSITSGEGGVITTSDFNYTKKLRQLRNHGIEIENGMMTFAEAGYNYRMTDFQAALAYSQVIRFNDILLQKQDLAEVYFNEITNFKIGLPSIPQDRNHTWQTFHVLLADDMDQGSVLDYLRKNNIGANYGAQCIPAQKYYIDKYHLDYISNYPNAYRAYTKGIALPLYERLNKQQIKYISNIINLL